MRVFSICYQEISTWITGGFKISPHVPLTQQTQLNRHGRAGVDRDLLRILG